MNCKNSSYHQYLNLKEPQRKILAGKPSIPGTITLRQSLQGCHLKIHI